MTSSGKLAPLNRSTAMQFQIDNLSCQHCVLAVTEAIKARDTQAKVAVDLALKQVAVDTTMPAEQVIAVLGEEGYPARLLPAAE
jgi:copper chaperone